jgi:hypothetical protein
LTTIEIASPYSIKTMGSIKLQRGTGPGQITFPANSGTAQIVVRGPSLAYPPVSTLETPVGYFVAAGAGYAGDDDKIAVSNFCGVLIKRRGVTPALVSIEGSSAGGTLKASSYSGGGTNNYATINGNSIN